MLQSRIPPLFLFGSSGAGKSDAGRHIVELMQSYGLASEFITSKQTLGAIVLEHVKSGTRLDREVHTEHLTLQNPDVADETNFQAIFHDGWALNMAHESLIATVARRWQETRGSVFVVAELANGPDVYYGPGKEPTRQTGTQFVHWIGRHGLLDVSLAWHFTAPFAIRAERNKHRPGYIPDPEFARLYPESEDFTPDHGRRFFDGRYNWIHNEYPTREAFLGVVEKDVKRILASRFGLEGASALVEKPSTKER